MAGGIAVNLQGSSGATYAHEAFPKNFNWNPVAGNYAAMRLANGSWTVIYVGETKNLQARLAKHENQPCFERNGWTHLAFHAEPNEATRLRIEADLMNRYRPPCNKEI